MSIDPLDNVQPGLEPMALDSSVGSKRILSDGTVMHENPNSFVQFTHRDDVLEEHITVPADDIQGAHWTATDGQGTNLGHEPLE